MLRLTLVFLGFLLAVQPHAFAQAKLATDEIVDSLRGLETAIEVDAPALHQRALGRIKAAPGQTPLNRPSIAEELLKLPQLTVEIQFNPDSDVIRPESTRRSAASPTRSGIRICWSTACSSSAIPTRPAGAKTISSSANGVPPRSARHSSPHSAFHLVA